jgi:hypothetical protein
MQEPSDGIAEELERQLQLALAAAAIAARRVIAARQQPIEQAARDSKQARQATKAQIDADRLLATERLRPVFDAGWWETAAPQDVADMWQEANSWRDPDHATIPLTIFDRAAGRIQQELHDRVGLDPTQVITLAAVQELEHEHQAALVEPLGQPVEAQASGPDVTASRGFDDPQRREQLRTRLAAAGVPEPAIEARTLADLGQAREATEAAQTHVAAAAAPRAASPRSAGRELRRQP